MRKYLHTYQLIVLILFYSLESFATNSNETNKFEQLKDYFMFPINPGKPNFLAGTMGELRPRHFHGGIDIKTGGKTGLPVYAAADGYVYRIKVSEGGYGNALYLRHTNGYISTYAHLSRYKASIAKYVLDNQYKKQKFRIELFPSKEIFPVKKGDIIAYSGNSGSSQGPHLHFEIRTPKEVPINVLRLGFKEISDNISPRLLKVAIKTLEPNARVNNRFGRFEFNVHRDKNGRLSIREKIKAKGKVGIQILYYDQMNGSYSKNGVPDIELYLNDSLKYKQQIDEIPFHHNRYILQQCDYKTIVEKRKRFNKLYVEKNNPLSFNSHDKENGLMSIEENQKYNARIVLTDNFQNKTTLRFNIQGHGELKSVATLSKIKNTKQITFNPSYEIIDNQAVLIKVPLNDKSKDTLELHSNKETHLLQPYYQSRKAAHYLWDLKLGIPENAIALNEISGNKKIDIEIKSKVIPKTNYRVLDPNLEVKFFKNSLFDTIYFQSNYSQTENKGKERFNIGDIYTPLFSKIKINLKPTEQYAKEKASVYKVTKNKYFSYVSSKWKENVLEFSTKEFGTYTILSDTTNPTIKFTKYDKRKVYFKIYDDLSGIKSYNAYLNGEWLLMNYDSKKKRIWSERLDKSKRLKGELVVEVVDNQNNKSVFKKQLL